VLYINIINFIKKDMNNRLKKQLKKMHVNARNVCGNFFGIVSPWETTLKKFRAGYLFTFYDETIKLLIN